MRNDFIDCMDKLITLDFDVEKNSALDLICSTMEIMRENGRTKLDKTSIYEALLESENV